MCCTVIVDGREIGGLDELVALVGVEAVVPCFPGEWPNGVQPANHCLCQIDLTATAAKAGYVEREHDGDPMEHHWVRAA